MIFRWSGDISLRMTDEKQNIETKSKCFSTCPVDGGQAVGFTFHTKPLCARGELLEKKSVQLFRHIIAQLTEITASQPKNFAGQTSSARLENFKIHQSEPSLDCSNSGNHCDVIRNQLRQRTITQSETHGRDLGLLL